MKTFIFMAQLAAGVVLLTFTGLIVDRFSHKANREAQAEERIAAALERAYPPPKSLPRPSMLDDGQRVTCLNGILPPYTQTELQAMAACGDK